MIRPECVELAEAGLTGANRLPGMVDRTVFLGSTTQVMVRLPQGGVAPVAGHERLSRATTWPRPARDRRLPPDSLRVLAASPDCTRVAYAENV